MYNKLIVAVVVAHPAERGTLPGRLWRANDTQFLFALQPKSLEQRPGSFILGAVDDTNRPALMLHNPAGLVLCLAPCDVLVLALLATRMVWIHQHRFGPKLLQGAPGFNANDDVAKLSYVLKVCNAYNDDMEYALIFLKLRKTICIYI
jgi:hypothetical protein